MDTPHDWTGPDADVGPDPIDEDLLTLFARTAPEVPPTDLDSLFARGLPERRRIMILRLAAGALTMAATAVFAFLLTPGRSAAGVSLEEVQQKVAATQTLTCTETTLVDGKPRDSSRMLVVAPSLVRDERDDGYAINDFRARRTLLVRTKEKTATILEGVAFPIPDEMNFYSLFREIAREPLRTLPERHVDGRPALGFVVKVFGHEATVWVDPATKLPVRVETESDEGGKRTTGIMSDFVFDRPLDPSLFAMTPPEGYKVETHGVAELAPEPAEQDLAAPVLTPLVGIGPARFGMTEAQVVKALGKPDRASTTGTMRLLSYYSRGFELMVLPEGRPKHGLFWAVALGKHGFMLKLREFRGKTDRGIGLGATRDDVVKAYGPPDREHLSRNRDAFKDAADPDKPTGQAEMSYDRLQLSFTLWEGKVYQIRIMAPPPAGVKPEGTRAK
ncbi:hypothetical protein OJF2_03250 [Aquisphaera giovannonii]|uniref:MucB/RseB N-terminal domain-containing protein n=1 Tax=Aquisphaera giovannonii TaxID=406548 RepID=A0A5B9VUC7_9BACT|nr:hypothetical protein [Aquisphaera giovannonii]QEH31858.1 hypothetical protein OJF2_03250 [Aquisphaera giovannonii]